MCWLAWHFSKILTVTHIKQDCLSAALSSASSTAGLFMWNYNILCDGPNLEYWDENADGVCMQTLTPECWMDGSLCCQLRIHFHMLNFDKIGISMQAWFSFLMVTLISIMYKTCKCGTWGHGLLLGLAMPEKQLDLRVWEVFSNLINSVIPWFCVSRKKSFILNKVSLAGEF